MRKKVRVHKPNLHIAFDLREGPWGGGNQFLQSLRTELRAQGRYAETLHDAQIVLINSFQIEQFRRLREVFVAKLRGQDILVLHRLDGPFQLVRGTNASQDRHVFRINQFVADGTVFQSNWSKRNNIALGLKSPEHSIIALNATHKPLQFGETALRDVEDNDNRIKIVTTSWSTNANKGHDDLSWLADHLDPGRFSITLIGNTNISNSRVSRKPPLPRAQLMEELRKYDVFFFPARNEPCSNALTEALAVGLPAIYFNGGANAEIVRRGGRPYDDVRNVPGLIEEVVAQIDFYRRRIELEDISEVASRYIRFAETLYQKKDRNRHFLWLGTVGIFFYGSGLIQALQKVSEAILKIREIRLRPREI